MIFAEVEGGDFPSHEEHFSNNNPNISFRTPEKIIQSDNYVKQQEWKVEDLELFYEKKLLKGKKEGNRLFIDIQSMNQLIQIHKMQNSCE